MISFLHGKIKYLTANWLILDVNGVGYKIQLKVENLKLKIGDEIEFYIYHHIREDKSELYGFKTSDELNIFELLLEVPGVGPKMGMNILNKASVKNIKNAISKGDAGFFTTISGVGKKLATKIILELKNKLDYGGYDVLSSSDLSTELIDAMESLGYKKNEIYPHISKIPAEIDSNQDKIKWLIKNMQR